MTKVTLNYICNRCKAERTASANVNYAVQVIPNTKDGKSVLQVGAAGEALPTYLECECKGIMLFQPTKIEQQFINLAEGDSTDGHK